MECFLLFLLMLVLTLAVVVVAAVMGARATRPQPFRALAQRYGGTYWRRGLIWGQPSIYFRYGAFAVPVTVISNSSASHGFTELQVQWPEARFASLIVPAHAAAAIRPKRGLDRFELGNDLFDRQYMMWSSDAADMKTFLSDGVQWQIERLRFFIGNHDVRIRVDQGQLLIRKRPRLRKYEDLDEFVRLALGLYDQAMLTRSVGIEFVRSAAAQPIDEAICRVCGDDITTDMVFCRRCKTPHHAECWQYFGACSTYGCQETQYIVPRMAQPWSDVENPARTKPR